MNKDNFDQSRIEIAIKASEALKANQTQESLAMTPKNRHILRPTEVDKVCGISKSTRSRLELAGKFPKRVILTERASGYFSDEIQAWLDSRPRAATKGKVFGS